MVGDWIANTWLQGFNPFNGADTKTVGPMPAHITESPWTQPSLPQEVISGDLQLNLEKPAAIKASNWQGQMLTFVMGIAASAIRLRGF